MQSFLHHFSKYLPKRIVANAELSARLGCTEKWIEDSSGILERRWAEPDETVANMAVEAAKGLALDRAPGLLLVSSGSSSTKGFPGPAAEIADRMGWSGVPALDVPIASAGSIFALTLASDLAAAYGDIVVVASEKMSALIEAHPLDPNTAILFGDGAGAALVSSRPGPWLVRSSALHTDGQFRDSLSYRGEGALSMNGLSVILQASRKLPAVVEEALGKIGMSAHDVARFVMHQANRNLILRVAKSLDVAAERFFSNIHAYGNTSSASMLIAAAECPEDQGSIVFAGFGAGFHWGALVAERANA